MYFWNQFPGLICLVLFFLVQEACAKGFETEAQSELNLREWVYPGRSFSDVNQVVSVINLQLPVEARAGQEWRFKLQPELQLSPDNNSTGERSWVEFPEAAFDYKSKKSGNRFQLGLTTTNWGVTDGFNPLDSVSSRRFEDPLYSEKLGAFSFLGHWESQTGDLGLDLIYIPHQRKSILPGEQSRWLPRALFQARSVSYNGQTASILLPGVVNYSYNSDETLDHADQNNFGVRVEKHFPSLDLALTYFNGQAQLPTTDVKLTGNVTTVAPILEISADPGIGISPVYYREEIFGGSVVYALGEFILRGEAAFTRVLSKRDDLPGLSNEFVAELEHSFDISSRMFTAIFELTYAQHSEAVDLTITSLNRMFDRSVILGGKHSFSETLQGGFYLVLDTLYHGQLYRLEGSQALSDTFKLSGIGEILSGDSGTPIGTYRYNSRLSANLKVSF